MIFIVNKYSFSGKILILYLDMIFMKFINFY